VLDFTGFFLVDQNIPFVYNMGYSKQQGAQNATTRT